MPDIAFAKVTAPKSGVLALPLVEGAGLAGAAAALDKALGGALTRAVEAAKFTGKKGSSASLLGPSAAFTKILLLGLGKEANAAAAEALGGALYVALSKEEQVTVLADGLTPEMAAHVALGARLRRRRLMSRWPPSPRAWS